MVVVLHNRKRLRQIRARDKGQPHPVVHHAVGNFDFFAADLKQKTTDAFNRYVAVTEERMAGELKPGNQFLYPDRAVSEPSQEMRDAYVRLKLGAILVERQETKLNGKEVEVHDGMVHHWVGLPFIPGAHLAQTLAVVQDYDHRAER